MTTETIIAFIGWTAAVLILAAYVLLSFGKISPQGRIYQWMNVVGSTGFIINSGYNGATPNAALNVVWAVIGVYTLWKIHEGRKAEAEATTPELPAEPVAPPQEYAGFTPHGTSRSE